MFNRSSGGHRGRTFLLLIVLVGWGVATRGQTPAQQPTQTPAPEATRRPAPVPPAPEERHGTVLFQSHGEAPLPGLPPQVPAGSTRLPSPAPGENVVPDLTDRERKAFRVTRYDLDLRIQPATSGLTMRAQLEVRNEGSEPLRLLPLQISSSLRWDGVAQLRPGAGRAPLPFVQHMLQTDADHTGAATEAVLTLSEPLAPGKGVKLDVFYSGTLGPSTGRLQRIGVSAENAAGVDWDVVGERTALRGFGNVLWYPVVSPQVFLREGNELFRAVGAARLRGQTEAAKLRLSVEYRGEPPAAAYFCARRQALRAIPEVSETPVGQGVAVAEFSEASIGFRVPSLFVVKQVEARVAPLRSVGEASLAEPPFSSSANAGTDAFAKGSANPRPSSVPAAVGAPAGEPLLAVETTDEGSLPALVASAQRVAPLLAEWFGPRPLSTLAVLDAGGQPFQDGPLLRASVAKLGASPAADVLVQSLAAAWVQTGVPWMDEGLSEFMGLLWTEQSTGRTAALAQMADSMKAVALAEPVPERPGASPAHVSGPGEPLIAAQSELFYRRKAAAVWWMLREIVGEDALRQTLSAVRFQPSSEETAREQTLRLKSTLKRTSGKDLGWFFDDWIWRDAGLPDLTLVDVTPRPLPAGQGHDSGWLVAVTVRNDGAVVADVPLVVRSGSFSVTRRLRVPGFGSVTDRVLVEAPPTEVVVNDGSVPELRNAVHSRTVTLHGP